MFQITRCSPITPVYLDVNITVAQYITKNLTGEQCATSDPWRIILLCNSCKGQISFKLLLPHQQTTSEHGGSTYEL